MSAQQEVVERALAYPYAVPATSFVLTGDEVRDADGPGSSPCSDEPDPTGHTQLLAYGSNASPEALARKLGESLHDSPVLALRATLACFDVVYSAHISRYGSVPATLQRSPGTEAIVFVLHLSEEQLRLIEVTEPNYELVTLRGISCMPESGEELNELATYVSRHGCLLASGSEVALAAVEARGRRFPAMTQRQALEHVRAALAPEQKLKAFVFAAASDPELARRRTEALGSQAAPLATSAGAPRRR